MESKLLVHPVDSFTQSVMDPEAIIDKLRNQGYYNGQIKHQEIVPGQCASFESVEVHRSVRSALRLSDINSLYQHQAEAINAIRNGNNIVLATPTASGKSLSYIIPGIERALSDGAKMIYVAPQIALINDQYDTLSEFTDNLGFGASADVAFYHSDLNDHERSQIKQSQPDILLTTPDMLHYSVIPYGRSSSNWQWLLRNLDMVAVDEVHAYRGVFGSHVSLVFRRLNRLCERYQNTPQYVCCSATIGNPIDHAATITGQDPDSFTLVDKDTSATGDRHWVFWNPPIKQSQDEREDHTDEPTAEANDTTESSATDSGPAFQGDDRRSSDGIFGDSGGSGERKSHHEQAAKLCTELVSEGYQTLVFTRTRQGAERYAKRVRHHLGKRGYQDLTDGVLAYHANLRDTERSEIEQGLKEGTIRGIWSTNALELGIDIGSLDAVILDGYPGSVMSTFQRAGRAGRGDDSCLIVLVGSDNPLDQYMLSNPEQLFETAAEKAVANPTNKPIIKDHVQCAANEIVLTPEDEQYFDDSLPEVVREAEDEGLLRRVESRPAAWQPSADFSSWDVNIRSIADRQITIQDRPKDQHITSLGLEAALRDAHPEAIFLHKGTTYQITEVDYNLDTAYAEEIRDTVAYTQPLQEKQVEILDHQDKMTLMRNDNALYCGLADMTVRQEMEGYLRYAGPNDDAPIEQAFDQTVPPYEIETMGMYFALSPAVKDTILETKGGSLNELKAGLHAIEHALISLLPREVLCDRGDVGGLSTGHHSETGLPTVFIHDAHQGGVGLSATAYETLNQLLDHTHRLIEDCGCSDGCPSCIHSPQCGNANRHLSKSLANVILDQYRD